MTTAAGAPRRAAVLVTDGYLDLEFWYPVLRLREAGADVTIVGPRPTPPSTAASATP